MKIWLVDFNNGYDDSALWMCGCVSGGAHININYWLSILDSKHVFVNDINQLINQSITKIDSLKFRFIQQKIVKDSETL